jgi:hypothetical protein
MNISQTDLLINISEGFIKSPFQIFISIIIIILFIGVFILIGIISAGRAKNILINQLFKKYEKLLQLFNITNEENKILKKLSIYLKNPDNKYLLLTDPNIFHNALNKLRTKENIEGVILHALEKKLGFLNFSPDTIIKSTFDINNGALVIIIFSLNRKITGLVIKSEEFLKVKISSEINFIVKKENAMIVTYNYTGGYVFNVRLMDYKGGIMNFTHSTKTKIYQRREFYRKNKKRFVYIHRKETEDEPETAVIFDLSGGGASIDNSILKFKVGNEFKISFPKIQNNKLIVNAEVIRISKNNSVIHVKFNNLIPLFYDKIIEIVNS